MKLPILAGAVACAFAALAAANITTVTAQVTIPTLTPGKDKWEYGVRQEVQQVEDLRACLAFGVSGANRSPTRTALLDCSKGDERLSYICTQPKPAEGQPGCRKLKTAPMT